MATTHSIFRVDLKILYVNWWCFSMFRLSPVLPRGEIEWSHSKINFPWNYKYFRRTWRCCKDFDLNIHFKSVNENQWHNNFMIVHQTLPLFRFSSNELYTIYWGKNSVMSETILCILRLRPRLSDSSLKIWDWDWDSRNQSHILRLILRLWSFGLK